MRQQDAADGPFVFGWLLAALTDWVNVTGVTRTGGFFLSFMSGNMTQTEVSVVHQDGHKALLIAHRPNVKESL